MRDLDKLQDVSFAHTSLLYFPNKHLIENKFKFYLTHNEKTKHKKCIDKKSFIEVFEEVYKDNECAMELLKAVLDQIFIIKSNKLNTSAEVEIELEDFQNYLLNHLLSPSREKIMYTAFTLLRAISRKKSN
jgi:hypothetical protein